MQEQGSAQDKGWDGCHSVPRGHPVCATRLRALSSSANTGWMCLGGLWLMFCKSHCSQGCQQPQDYCTGIEMRGMMGQWCGFLLKKNQ